MVNRREFVVLAAAAPLALRRDSDCAELPAALVTCDAESRLAVVDLGLVPRRPPPPRRCRIRARSSSSGRRAVVCHTAVGAVSIVDRHGVRHVLRGLEEPRYTAAHPDGRHAFVTDSGRSGVVAIDVAAGRVLGRVALPGWARHITIDATGARLWVGLGSASPHVAVVDARRLRHVATLTPGFGAHDVGLAPDGRLWVTAGRFAPARRRRRRSCRRPGPAARHVRQRARVRDERRCGRSPRAESRRPGPALDSDSRRLVQRPVRPRARDHAVARPRHADGARRARRAARARRGGGLVPRRVFLGDLKALRKPYRFPGGSFRPTGNMANG